MSQYYYKDNISLVDVSILIQGQHIIVLNVTTRTFHSSQFLLQGQSQSSTSLQGQGVVVRKECSTNMSSLMTSRNNWASSLHQVCCQPQNIPSTVHNDQAQYNLPHGYIASIDYYRPKTICLPLFRTGIRIASNVKVTPTEVDLAVTVT